MKKIIVSVVLLTFFTLPFALKAQDVKEENKAVEEKTGKKEKVKDKRKETQEVVIRNLGDKELKLKVEIDGDKITVNGKPLSEFKDAQVTINNRKMSIRDGDRFMTYNFNPDGLNFSKDFMGEWKGLGKEITKPFLGVTTEKVTEGAKVIEVVKESAAEKAGLKKDDIITKVGDEKITDGENLSEVISAKKPKEVVNVTYLRNGKENSLRATLGEKKMKSPLAMTYGTPNGNIRSFSLPKINGEDMGLDRLHDLELMSPDAGYNSAPYINGFPRQKRLGLKIQDMEEGGNVKVIAVEEGSAAEKAGLKKDDIITEIGGVKIENTDDAREQLSSSEAKAGYSIKAKRGTSEMTFEVKFPKKLKTANL